MKVPGKRIHRTRLIQTDRYVVAIDIEIVLPDEDPSEPCYEAETVNLIREVRQRAEHGDLDWLKARAKVYESIDAVCEERRRSGIA